MVEQVLGLLLGEVEAVVDEAPPEVFDVELSVAVVVHGLEDPGDALDAARRTLQQLRLHLGDQVVNRERL